MTLLVVVVPYQNAKIMIHTNHNEASTTGITSLRNVAEADAET
jgi:hypothetical protein